MYKRRYPLSNDYELRLQLREVVPAQRRQLSEPKQPPYPYRAESANAEKDDVVALTWPQESGWRYH